MDNPTMAFLLPPLLRSCKDVLFGNMPEIYDFHNNIFLHHLESCLEAPERVGCCFLEKREDFQMYEKYCQNKPQSESLWRQHAESLFFQVLCLSTASTINGIHFETFRGFPSAENVGGVITEF
ncbi:proto-oncogene DBL-like isoform X1 [Notechis scutatus]|uniref:Proto-oncogene DBL-like isoform X1 n=1 Tax=Notechis scutatus TaxID=8663 RepID=A0A6J1WD13_9SAUR|nr:proto-oncogene DBL-like isoform X1 [Notechis scutatus]